MLLPATRDALADGRRLDDALADLVAALRRWTGSALGDDVALLATELVSEVVPPPPTAQSRRADIAWSRSAARSA